MATMPMRHEFFHCGGRGEPAYNFPSPGAPASYYSGASYQGWPADYHCDYNHGRNRMPTIELMVPMCCTNCEGQVRAVLLAMEGVRDVVTDPYTQRVIVTGYAVDPMRALRQVKHVNENAALWRDLSSTRNDLNGDDIVYHHRYSESGSSRSPRDQYSKQTLNGAALDSGISSNNVSYTTSHCPGHAGSTSATHFVIPAPDHVERVEFH